ncbi:glycerophosphodiester phosphodiesterase family protein [Sphingobium sp.]|uniref:glycerophosphodiester phosphodiesterase family protein n=1 Tax=Sphingobium sp. TaxID=1912891 RepID=UPI003B3B349B
MAAFDAAIAAGHGIECDVRASRDGVAFVFHDATLRRMTGRDAAIADLDAAHIDAITLPDGGAIPRLSTLLARCDGHVPLLVEIKAEQAFTPICEAVARDLADWPGAPVAIMSFHPRVVRWFAKRRHERVRGIVLTQQGKGWLRGRIERALALWLSKPDFLACDIRDLPSNLSRNARKRGMAVLTWTVRSESDRARAAAHADRPIYERADD